MTTQTITVSNSKVLPMIFAMALGVALLGLSGMAQATVLHDAAHDQRHAMAFPCH
jgi:cobalt transporter subunit CbtB